MPLYDYKCPNCKTILEDIYNTIDNRRNTPLCKCGVKTELILPTSFSNGLKGYPYYDSVLDIEITSRGHKNAVMKQHNLVERG